MTLNSHSDSSRQVYVAYFRVSTERQGRSGLGLEAQRSAVETYVRTHGGQLVGEFLEIESGKRSDRPELAKALSTARAQRAVLIIAKLDRLARNARFLLSVVEGAGQAGLAFCELPQLPTGPVGKFMVTMLAAVAELEAGMISQRTKAALDAARARGVKLGNPNLRRGSPEAARRAAGAASARASSNAKDVLPFVREAQLAGAKSLREVAKALEARGIRTPRGSVTWAPAQVSRVIKRAEQLKREFPT